MSHRFDARAAALASLGLLFLARTATATPLEFGGELTLTIQIGHETLVFPLQGGGVANVDPNGAGPHLTAISLPAGALTAQGLAAPMTDPSSIPINGVKVTAANAAGVLVESNGRLQGPLPIAGVMKLCLFGPCSAAFANIALPLNVVGQGGNEYNTAVVNVTVAGAPWTTGTVEIGDANVRGGAHGPAGMTSTTAQLGGALNLVTPIFISTNIAPMAPWPSLAQLAVRFGGASLLECGNGIDDDGDGLVDLADPGCTKASDISERQAGHVCDDGVDNDGDGLVDFPADPGCTSPTDMSEGPDCQDGIDNDGDGRIDFPNDPGCTSATDSSEHEIGLVCDDGIDNDGDGLADYAADPGCTSPSDPSEAGECQDGIDNDGDGLIDYPADPGCASPSSRNEAPECSDHVDNDGDGAIDFPADPGCTSPSDVSEVLDCQDGRDNDGDGLYDYPEDPGCTSAFDASEQSAASACDDGIDNDADGLTDFPDDPGCASAEDRTEQIDCADGIDNDGDGLVDLADPGCANAADGSEHDAALPCDDGVDNDGDGLVDYPADPGCTAPDAPTELGACQDGLDNDGDGYVDYPADPGCESPTDPSEHSAAFACDDGIDNDGDGLVDMADPGCPFPYASPENPQCDDGIDNDGNGLVDFDDPKCSRSWPYWEKTPTLPLFPGPIVCGLGAELALMVPLIGWLRGRRRRP